MLLKKSLVCKNAKLTKYKFLNMKNLQNHEFEEMQGYKMQLQKSAKWNGPPGPPYKTHPMVCGQKSLMMTWPLIIILSTYIYSCSLH